MQPNTPFPTRSGAERWRISQAPTYQGPAQLTTFLGNQPRVLPTGPAEAPGLSRKLLRLMVSVVVLMLLLLVALVAFLIFGEERSPEQRPALTAHQRAQAFR